MLTHSRFSPWALRGSIFIIPLAIFSTALPAAPRARIKVIVHQQGNTSTALMTVPVPPQRAWTVLTNYVATGEAMPDISEVRLLSRQGNLVRVRQIYQAPYTFGLTISATLAVKENPKTAIRFHMLEGDRIRKLNGSWMITPDKNGTRIKYTISLVPELPGMLQPVFADLTRSSLHESMQRLSGLMQAKN